MNLEKIGLALEKMKKLKRIKISTKKTPLECGISMMLEGILTFDYYDLKIPVFEDAQLAAYQAAEKAINAEILRLDAEVRGLILEARQEERPDAYLDEIVKAFGPHQGLNANWAVMAWHLGGEVWLCDDENDRTVSIVTRRITTEIDEIVEVAGNVTPARALQIWAMISEEGR